MIEILIRINLMEYKIQVLLGKLGMDHRNKTNWCLDYPKIILYKLMSLLIVQEYF